MNSIKHRGGKFSERGGGSFRGCLNKRSDVADEFHQVIVSGSLVPKKQSVWLDTSLPSLKRTKKTTLT